MTSPASASTTRRPRSRPKLWIHGHAHDSFDDAVNGTRVLGNPRGYAKRDAAENPRFVPELVVDVG